MGLLKDLKLSPLSGRVDRGNTPRVPGLYPEAGLAGAGPA